MNSLEPHDGMAIDHSGHSPSPSNHASSSRRTRRSLTSQACDACRVRKTRCNDVSSPSPSLSPAPAPVTTPSPVRSHHYPPSPPRRCRRCDTLDLSCTYLLPTATRGPRRKGAATRQSKSHAPVEVAVVAVTGNSGSEALPPPPPFDQLSPSRAVHQHQHQHPQYPTDVICHRELVQRMMADYLKLLYPLIPVVHRPSFRQNLARDRDRFDNDFLGLVLALCAATVGTMPSRFAEYCTAEPPIPFQSRTEMINRCYEVISSLRGPSYFDEISFSKWAISYLMQISFFQIGQHNRARMVEVEGMQLARLLDFHQISIYDGLNCIESQLRKKAFWLMFYGYVHGQMQNLRKERLSYLDEFILGSINLEDLIPLEVDDEMILEDTVLPQPAGQVSVTTGFNIHSRVFWAALKSRQPQTDPCHCVLSKDPALQLTHLQDRRLDLKYMLDNVPAPLRQWSTSPNFSDPVDANSENQQTLNGQFASMRANLHITHLWLQSILLDQIETLLSQKNNHQQPPTNLPPLLSLSPDPKALWTEREDICRQLLHILHGIPEDYLEPNGHHLTFKVRDVAVTLLACPFEAYEEISKRAQHYLDEFTKKLSRLDGSETMNTVSLQSWVDTDRNVY